MARHELRDDWRSRLSNALGHIISLALRYYGDGQGVGRSLPFERGGDEALRNPDDRLERRCALREIPSLVGPMYLATVPVWLGLSWTVREYRHLIAILIILVFACAMLVVLANMFVVPLEKNANLARVM
jgi:hypothetical protein